MPIECTGYRALVAAFETLMAENASLADVRLAPDKWTLKEMVAHLVDSACNNHQRFVRLQLQDALVFPKYDAEEWRTVTGVTPLDYATVTTLWKSYNLLLLHLVENVNPAALGHVWKREDRDITLEELMHDYFAHMELHRKMFAERVGEIGAVQA